VAEASEDIEEEDIEEDIEEDAVGERDRGRLAAFGEAAKDERADELATDEAVAARDDDDDVDLVDEEVEEDAGDVVVLVGPSASEGPLRVDGDADAATGG